MYNNYGRFNADSKVLKKVFIPNLLSGDKLYDKRGENEVMFKKLIDPGKNEKGILKNYEEFIGANKEGIVKIYKINIGWYVKE